MIERTYIGQELDLFSRAIRWKKYFGSVIAPYIGKRVLEVGAAIGGTTSVLCEGKQDLWVCLEPDKQLRSQIDQMIIEGRLPCCCRSKIGTINALGQDEFFDTVLYIDVLEHIEYDKEEVSQAISHLSEGGRLIVLSPAHNFLFSKFDQSIGHYRRYWRKSLLSLIPSTCKVERTLYLDSLGLLASLANRFLLKQSLPKINQILFWDTRLIPISIWLDRLLNYRIGRSVIGIWKRARA